MTILLVALALGLCAWLLFRSFGFAAPLETPTAATEPVPADPLTAQHTPGSDSTAHLAGEAQRDRTVATASRSSQPALIGFVVDTSGTPIANAELVATPSQAVDLNDPDSFTDLEAIRARMFEYGNAKTKTRTHSDGSFRLSIPPMGTDLRITVAARGYQIFFQQLAGVPKSEHNMGTLTLQLGAIVSGQVIDSSQRPVAGASVGHHEGKREAFDSAVPFYDDEARSELSDELRTDAEGRFELAHVPPGNHTLSAQHRDYPITHLNLQVALGTAIPNVVLKFDLGATIRGKVTGHTGNLGQIRVVTGHPRRAGESPLPSALAAMTDSGQIARSATPGADGAFTLRGLAARCSYHVYLIESAGIHTRACKPSHSQRSSDRPVDWRRQFTTEGGGNARGRHSHIRRPSCGSLERTTSTAWRSQSASARSRGASRADRGSRVLTVLRQSRHRCRSICGNRGVLCRERMPLPLQ